MKQNNDNKLDVLDRLVHAARDIENQERQKEQKKMDQTRLCGYILIACLIAMFILMLCLGKL